MDHEIVDILDCTNQNTVDPSVKEYVSPFNN